MAWGLAAAALVLVALWLPAQRLEPPPQGGQYSSGTGEVRVVRLEDGSAVILGADSALRVELTATQRRVRLLRGEAFFDVARDEQRPFLVRVDDVAVRVLGTRFEVHKGVAATRVMVEHGLVTVQAPAPGRNGESSHDGDTALLLAAGEAAVRAPGDSWARLGPGRSPTTGWRDGRLAYDGAPLREVIADANRYYDQVIVLADPELGDLRVTASFRAREIDQLIGVLEGAVGVRAERVADGRLMLFTPDL
nr:FecR domain-containing protein [Parahaliea mediterranea]